MIRSRVRRDLDEQVAAVDAPFVIGSWSVANLGANQTDAATMTLDPRVAVCPYRTTRAVKIHATVIALNSVGGTVGSLTISIFVNGVDSGAAYDLVLSGHAIGDQRATKVHTTPLEVPAGADIELRWSTSADWNSTSADIIAHLEAYAKPR